MSYIRDNKSQVNEDFNASSISNDSVFDWGVTLPTADQDHQGSSDKGHVSRYDPNAMRRITDISDLVDDNSGTDSDDDAIIGHSSGIGAMGVDLEYGISSDKQQTRTNYGPGGVGKALFCRQTITIVSLVAIIFAASLAIGYSVLSSDQSKTHHPRTENVMPEQKLLEIAERVVIACSEQSLDADISECQKLCHLNMCCFESGEYSCEEDEKKECAVYAGCKALVEGVPLGAAEEDEE